MATYYLGLSTHDLEYFRETGQQDIKEAYIVNSENTQEYWKGDNVAELVEWVQKNVLETSDILIHGDKGLHNLLYYMKNNIGRKVLKQGLQGTVLKSITWTRQRRLNGKVKKYTINIRNVQSKYPTLNNSGLDVVTAAHNLMDFINSTAELFDTKNFASTISHDAMQKWKSTSVYGSAMSEWLKKPLLDAEGKHICDTNDKPLFENDNETWVNIHKAYNGGFIYVNPKYQMKHLKQKLYHYDVNSMYTHIMDSEMHPVGKPIFNEHHKDATYKMYKVYIDRAETDTIPFIATNTNFEMGSVRTDIWGNESVDRAVRGKKRPKVITDTIVHMNNYTYEYFEKYYYGEWKKEFIVGFREAYDIFKEYNDGMMELKELFNEDKTMRGYIKQALQAPYGKNAQKQGTKESKVAFEDEIELEVRDDGWAYYNNRKVEQNGNLVYYQQDKEATGNLSYIPVSQSISSKAELFMLDKILNRDDVVYVDTDSIISTTPRNDLEIHETKLGAWKVEAEYNELVVRGMKHYYGYTDEGHVLKGAGAILKDYNPTNLPLEKYAEPEVTLEYGRLMRAIVKGGLIEFLAELKLVDTRKDYEWKELQYEEKEGTVMSEEEVASFF